MEIMLLQLGGRSCGLGWAKGGCHLACFRFPSEHRLLAKLSFIRCNISSNRLILRGPLVAGPRIGGDHRAGLLGVTTALEVSTDAVKRRERLSKEERTIVVETYVRRHMASHQGKFPTLAAVLKETGGSRNIVRDILQELAGTMKLKDAVTMVDTELNILEAESEIEQKDLDPSLYDSSLTEVAISSLSNGVSMAKEEISEPNYETAGYVHEDSKNVICDDHDLEESIMRETDNGLPAMNQNRENVSGNERISLWERLHANSSTKANQRNGAYVSELRAASCVSDVGTHSGDNAGTPHLWDNGEMDNADFASLDYPEGAYIYKSSAGKIDSSSEQIAEQDRAGPSSSKNVLFVRFLHPEATEEDLRAAFQDCGRIMRARPVRSRRGFESKYIYGFVDFDTTEGLNNALKKDVQIRGIRVEARRSTSKLSFDLSSSSSDPFSSRRATSTYGLGSAHILKPSHGDAILDEGYPVLLQDVPQEIVFQVQDALSAHGDIISSYSKVQDSGNVSVYVSFKTEIAKESALAAHWIHLGGKPYRIRRLDSPKTTVVRISNIAAETSEEKIFNACKSCGYIDSVKPRTVGVVDVYFHPNEIRHMIHILDRLNEVNIDKRRWRAQPAPICCPKASPEICRSVNGRKWLQSQQWQVLGSLENSLKDALMHTEDLRVLLSLQGANGTLASRSNKIDSLTSLIRDVAKS